MSGGNFYEVLGIDADASPEDVRRAYKRRALQTHPDRLPQGATPADKEAAGEQFRNVNNAYEILIDSRNRKLYDMYGVWPPPEEFPEQSSPQRRDRPNYPSPHRPSGPFDDPFFHSPFFEAPFPRHHPPGFIFRDPFELFDSIFADMQRDFHHAASPFNAPSLDPFSFSRRPNSMFNHLHSLPMPGISPFLLSPHLFDPAAFPNVGSSSAPDGAQTFSFQSSSRGRYAPGPDGQDPHWVSESRMVRTINGVTQTIHKKLDSNGNEHVKKIYPDGREKYTINGVEHPSSSRHIQDAPPQGQVQDFPADTAPFIPPQPEAAGSKKRWWGRH